jgi:hypothetical protein
MFYDNFSTLIILWLTISGDQVPSNTTKFNYSINIHSSATCFDMHVKIKPFYQKIIYRTLQLKCLKMHLGSGMFTNLLKLCVKPYVTMRNGCLVMRSGNIRFGIAEW